MQQTQQASEQGLKGSKTVGEEQLHSHCDRLRYAAKTDLILEHLQRQLLCHHLSALAMRGIYIPCHLSHMG